MASRTVGSTMKIAFAGVEALPNLVFWNRVFPLLPDEPPVLLSSNLVLGRTPGKILRRLSTIFRRSGPGYLAYVLSLSLQQRQGLSAEIPSLAQLLRQHRVEVIPSGNFSQARTIQALEAKGVTHVVSHYCDQIFQPNFLQASFETLNLHPSPLPEYRGVDPLFQQMLDGNPELGVTLHQVNLAIDEGPILDQTTFPHQVTTHREALIQAAEAAAELFARWLQEPARPSPQPQVSQPRTPYHSWPTKDQLHQFRQKGLRLT